MENFKKRRKKFITGFPYYSESKLSQTQTHKYLKTGTSGYTFLLGAGGREGEVSNQGFQEESKQHTTLYLGIVIKR